MQGTFVHHTRRLIALGLILAATVLVTASAQPQGEATATEQVLSLLAEGDLQFNARDYEGALRLYETASRLSSQDPHIQHRLRLAQQREAARQRFLLTVPTDSSARADFLERHYDQALQLLSEHRLEAAHQRFEEIFFVDPGYRRVTRYLERIESDLATLHEERGGAAPTGALNLPAAPAPGLDSILITPGMPSHDDLMQEGEALLEQGNAEGAYEIFTQALMTDPNSRAAQRARTRAAHAVARTREEQVQDQLRSAAARVEAGRFDEARAVYGSILAANPDSEEAQEGVLALEEAEREFLRTEREVLIASNLDTARQALRQDNLDGAQSSYEAVLSLDANNRAAQRGMEEIEAAREQAAQRAMTDTVDSHLAAAREALAAQDFDTAGSRVEAALAIDPTNSDARRLTNHISRAQREAIAEAIANHVQRGEAAIEAGRLEDARRITQEILALEANSTEANSLVAQIERAETEAEAAARRAAERLAETERQQDQAQREATIQQALSDGRNALRSDAYGEAIRHAETVLALDPDNATARRLREDAMVERDSAALAVRQETRTAAELTQDEQISALLEQAEDLLDDDQFAEAIEAAERVFEIDVDNADAQRLIAQARVQAQEAEQRQAQQSVSEREEQIEDLLSTARRALRRERYAEATSAAEQILAMDPENAAATALIARVETERQTQANAEAEVQRREQIESLIDQARRSLRSDDYAAAIATAQQVLDLDAGNEDANELIADAQQGQAEAASAALERQIEDLLDQARQNLRAGNHQAAIDQANQVLSLDAENAAAASLIGEVNQAQQAAVQSAEAAEQAQQVQALMDRALAELDGGDPQAALATLQEAQALDPENRGITRRIRAAERAIENMQAQQERAVEETEEMAQDAIRQGERALRRGRYADAAESFRAALGAVPGYAPAEQGLAAAERGLTAEQRVMEGNASLEAGEIDRAESQFRAALELVPDLEAAQDGLAEVAEAQQEAAREAERAAAIAQEEAERQGQEQSALLVSEAEGLIEAGQLDAAQARLNEALAAWPDNRDAQRALESVQEMQTDALAAAQMEAAEQQQALITGLLQQGREAYDAGDIISAVERWNRVLEIDPNNDHALTYLAETADEHRGAVAMQLADQERQAREAEMQDRLGTPISITTPAEGTPLQVFLDNISVFTDLNFVIADGVDVQVTGSFIERPLRQVLNAVITANGLRWEVEDNIITIQANLGTQFHRLTADDMAALTVFRDRGFLDMLLYPPDGISRVAGETYEVDEITGTFVVTGNPSQLERVNDLVASLSDVSPTPVDIQMFRVREDEGDRIRTLIEAILEAERTPQTQAFERTIILQGPNLIVRATERELRRIEELLAEFGEEGLEGPGLEVATFSLIPRRILQGNEEIASQFAQSIRETVEVLLYSQEGAAAARRQGRRLWYDEFTMQLTITDTPDNIERVTRYISSIPILEERRTTRIVNLDHQTASSLASKLSDFLDIEIRGGGGGGESTSASGDVVVRTLREDDEFTFRDLRITLIEVEENDIDDDRDEDVTMIIDTLNSSEERTIEELRSEIVDNYRIRIVDADASGTGKAEIEITYLGANGGGGGGGGGGGEGAAYQISTTDAQGGASTGGGGSSQSNIDQAEENRIPIVQADDDTNSLLISVVNPGDLDLILQAIDLLDTPILQAQIETKFVEVNENRARELKSELSLSGIGQEGINFDDSFFSARYAQDVDEFRNVFEPSLESPVNANLPKATTVLSLVTGGSSPMTWELAFLEAEGVVNTVNGPFIVAQNNQDAEFQITQQYNRFGPIAGVSVSNNGDNNQQTIGAAGNGANLIDIELVDMDVTPTISQSGYITLELDINISNFSNQLGQLITSAGALGDAQTGLAAIPDAATQNIFGVYSNNLKELDTTARVRDGGTVVLGGWTLERITQTSSGIPVLRNLPYVGQVFFSRNQDLLERLTLLIFLTATIVDIE